MAMWCGARKKGLTHSDKVIGTDLKSEMPPKWWPKLEVRTSKWTKAWKTHLVDRDRQCRARSGYHYWHEIRWVRWSSSVSVYFCVKWENKVPTSENDLYVKNINTCKTLRTWPLQLRRKNICCRLRFNMFNYYPG